MSAHLYTSIYGQLVKISTFPGPKTMDSQSRTGSDWLNSMEMTNNITGRTLLAESFQFATKSGKFEPNGEKVTLALGDGSYIRLLAVASIIDSRTGLKIPCAVVEQQGSEKRDLNLSAAGDGTRTSQIHRTYQILIVFLFVRRGKFVVRGFFPLTHSLESAKLFLCDGPTICWEHQGHVYITQTFSESNQTKVDVTQLNKCLWKPSNSLKWFGVTNGDAIAMGTVLSSEQEHSSVDMLCDFSHKWMVVKLPLQQETEVSNAPIGEENAALPHEYSDIVNCVKFCQYHISQSGSRCLRNSDPDIAASGEVVLAATNQFQLVEASGGIIRRVCNLPFNDTCKIDVAMVTGGEELIIVHSTGGRVCTLRSSSFEVVKEWEGFYTVLVDDFLFTGAEQVLLLGCSKDAPQDSFLLTDFGTCNRSSKESEDIGTCKTPACAGNLQSAVQALESQIQTGMAALRFSESQCDLKSQLIKQSQDALYRMAEKLPSVASPCNSLVCFCDLSGKDDVEETGGENVSMNHDAILRCLCGWQRVVDDCWIVGVEVKNQTGRAVSDVMISLIPANTTQTSLHSATSTCSFNPVVSSTAACFTSSRPGPAVERTWNHGESFGKRIKLDHGKAAILDPGQTTTVIGVTGIPTFTSQPVSECTVMLTWRERIPSNRSDVTAMDIEVGSREEKDEFVERQGTCGTAVLHASDVVTGKLEINPLDHFKSALERKHDIHDIQALDAHQLATPLLLSSKHSNLRCVEGILTGSMGCKCLASDGMIIPSGALAMMRIKIASRDGPSKMGVTVYSRNQSDLLLFCQHLYQSLPDDVTIKPLPPANQIRSAMATTLRAIDKELQHRSSHLQQLLANESSSMLQGHSAQGTTTDDSWPGTSSEDKRDKVRGEFEGERRQWCNSDVYLEVSAVGEAQKTRRDLLDLRTETDVDVLNLAGLLSVANF